MSGVNNPVQTADIAEPIVASGSGVSDFDELEQLDSQAKATKKAEKAEAKKAAEPKGAKDYEKPADSKEEKASKEKGKEEAKDAKPKRTYKIKAGDIETELNPEGVMEVTVDGKPVPVALQELINNYSGKVAWDKKFSELDNQRKGFYSEKENIAKAVQRFYKTAVEEGDVESALEVAAEAFGANPLEIREAYRKRQAEAAQGWSGKSPEEIQALLKEQELESYRKREQSRAEAAEEQKLRAEITARVDKIREAHGLDETQFNQAYQELKAHGVAGITPETVGEYVSELKARTLIQDAIKQASPEIDEAKLDAAIDDLRKAQKAQGLTDKDIAEIAQEVYGKVHPAKKLAKRVEARGGTVPAVPRNPAHEPFSFDDI